MNPFKSKATIVSTTEPMRSRRLLMTLRVARSNKPPRLRRPPPLEQITANVTATSSRVEDARNTVKNARSKADSSSAVVQDAISAMERIERSSQQIGQIIGVIDEIAFQTNLLALNAGVEVRRGLATQGRASLSSPRKCANWHSVLLVRRRRSRN
jgi:hypothetical protein